MSLYFARSEDEYGCFAQTHSPYLRFNVLEPYPFIPHIHFTTIRERGRQFIAFCISRDQAMLHLASAYTKQTSCVSGFFFIRTYWSSAGKLLVNQQQMCQGSQRQMQRSSPFICRHLVWQIVQGGGVH